jgi:hypothetical protein
MRVVSVALAVLFGSLVLLGYFVPQAAGIQALLLNWSMILAAAAALVGVLNLVFVHTNKIRRREKGYGYSAFLVAGLVFTLVFGLIQPLPRLLPAASSGNEWIADKITFVLANGIVFPVEAALMGLLAVTLLYAAIRLLRRRANVMSFLFLATAFIVLLGAANVPPFTYLHSWITNSLTLGGARGILIGVALGTLAAGLRVLFGMDRPYGGN